MLQVQLAKERTAKGREKLLERMEYSLSEHGDAFVGVWTRRSSWYHVPLTSARCSHLY